MSKANWNRKLNIVFTSLLSLILIFGVGTWVGYSFTGTTNTFAPGSLETTNLNVTGDWYRGSTDLTDRLQGDWGSTDLETTGMISSGDFNVTSEFYWNTANRTVLVSGQNATGATAYVGFDSDLEYLPNYFLCDGVADDVQIQAAIVFVEGLGGGTVLLERGAFSTSTMMTISFSNLSLMGSDDTLIIAASRGGNSYLIDIADGIENVEISHIEFQADLTDPDQFSSIICGEGATEDIYIHHCRFIAKIYSGKPTPEDQTDSSFARAIAVSPYGINWKIYKNVIEGTTIEAISVTNVSPENTDAGPRYCEVSNNLIRNCRMGIAIEKGAKFTLCEANIILDTEDFYAILLRHEGTTDNVIIGNIIRNNTSGGIELDGSHRNYVANNFIYNVSNGILITEEASFNTIKNNEIYKSSGTGIFFAASSGEYNDVYGDTVKYCGADGIAITNRQKRVEANHVEYCQHYGILLGADSEGTHVLNNIVGNAMNRGIYITHTSLGIETRIEGNTIFDDQDDDTTTINGGLAAGVSDIPVVDATSFEIGQAIQTQPTGFANENHYISEINYVENIITLEGVLANGHTNGDPLIGRTTTTIGIDEETTTDYNIIRNNRFYDIATYVVIEGANTELATVTLPFVNGSVFLSTASFGWEIDLNTEYALALGALPIEVQQVVRWKIWAVSVVGETHNMTLQIEGYGGADNEPYTTETIAIATLNSTSFNFEANDGIHWTMTSSDDADLDHFHGGDIIMIKVLHEAASVGACQTDAIFLCVEIEYV